jgi:N-acetylneuraminic acid mutarotase
MTALRFVRAVGSIALVLIALFAAGGALARPASLPGTSATPPLASDCLIFPKDNCTPTPSRTPLPSPTNTATTMATGTATPTSTALPTDTPVPSPTNTLAPPTATCAPPGWRVVAPLPLVLSGPGLDSDGKRIYSAGGFRNSLHVNSALLARYDPAANAWTTLAPVPDPISEAAAVFAQGKLFLFGGGSGVGPYTVYNYTRIYDPVTNAWSYAAPMPGPRRRLAGAYANGAIFITGGLSGDLNPQTVENQTWAYDIAANTWSTRAPMPIGRAGHTVEMISGHLFVIAGHDNTFSYVAPVHDYDTAANTWSTRAALPTPREWPGSGVVNGRIWVFGGGWPYNPTAITEIFDPAANAWSAGPIQTVPRSIQGGAAAGPVLVSVAGYDAVSAYDTTEIYNTAQPPCEPTPAPTRVPTDTPAPPTATCEPAPPPAWYVAAPLPRDVSRPALASDGLFVYSAGGFNSAVRDAIDQFLRYDPVTNHWEPLAPMLHYAYSASAIHVNGKLYVFGGGVENASFADTRIYDIAAGAWSYGAPMPAARQQMAAGYFDGRVYLAAGLTLDDFPDTAQNQTWAYDVAANQWTTRASLPIPLGGPASDVVNGHLYVFGGRARSGAVLGTTYDYDIAGDVWTTRSPVPTARNVPASAVLNGRVWVFGGGDPFIPINAVEVYNPQTGAWSAGPAQNVARAFEGSTVIDNTIVAAGGWQPLSSSAVEVLSEWPDPCTPPPTPPPGTTPAQSSNTFYAPLRP